MKKQSEVSVVGLVHSSKKKQIKVSVNWLNSSMRNQNKVNMIGLIHSSMKQQSKVKE
jgi:Tfp pilus assembly protein PilZ